MDIFTREHLQAWADATLHDDERDKVVQQMVAYVERNPEVLGLHTFSWEVIRSIVAENK